MSWLIVAKIPLLMSSRMMSATFTPRSSASSLTVMVPGSSIGPRSFGSIVCTWVWKPPSRRGGLRGPRRPRVPLLLLATGSSFDGVVVRVRPQLDAREERRRDGGLERPRQGAPGIGDGEAGGGPADVRAAAGQPAGLVDDDRAVGCPDEPNELALGSRG